ncbi:DUF2080 family transposase-associated protein [Halostella litorea]|uniref:DUF2080 family transposase-associated protein n=1 Tax=Halostella litorea TaxID=2528831 RepID=UPI001091FB0B
MDKYEIEGDEVIEREVKATGNGAHVYLPKEWLDHTVKVVRLSQDEEPEFKECAVCNRVTKSTVEWCWTDESGGSFFQICTDCRSEVADGPEDVCAVCREDRKMSRSSGFGPGGGPNQDWYNGCDTCRERVIFGNKPSPQPAWIE